MADQSTTNDNRGWHGDSAGHAKAGAMGGKKTAAERGSEYFEEIGSTGGSNQGAENNSGNFANDPQRASDAGKKGGSASGSND